MFEVLPVIMEEGLGLHLNLPWFLAKEMGEDLGLIHIQNKKGWLPRTPKFTLTIRSKDTSVDGSG